MYFTLKCVSAHAYVRVCVIHPLSKFEKKKTPLSLTPSPHPQCTCLHMYVQQIDAWIRYLDHKKAAHKEARFRIFERAVKQLPGSYKLWYRYLKERRRAVRGTSPADPARKEVNHAFDRALVFMHKMPRIWIDYLKFLTKQRVITVSSKPLPRRHS